MQRTKEIFEKYRSFIILIAFAIVISILNPRFLQTANLLNVLRQTSINAIIAAGVTFVILTGGIDISVGSILAFVGAVAAWMVTKEINLFMIIVVALLIGAAAGLFNGVLITRGNLQPMIVTLATMTLFRGFTLVFTDGKPISFATMKSAAAFKWIGAGTVGPIPTPIIIMILLFALCYFVLNNTAFGRHLYAIGGNEEAAFLSGVNAKRTKVTAFMVSGMTAALAGLIVTARLSSAQPTAGTGYEMDAIAAVVLGGTSLTGGQGNILGTVVGALIIGMLNNALNLMDVSSYYQTIVKGVVIIAAVLLDSRSRKK